MTRGEIIDDYRRFNAKDRSAFRRWLVVNMVAGALVVSALIAVTSVYSGADSSTASAQKDAVKVHAQAR
jgi:hypothetical protein